MPNIQINMNNKLLAVLTTATVLCLVGVVYWPLHLADFVWDDQVCMHDAAWLRQGDVWNRFISTDFCGWKNYFRPLVVALFSIELRAFDATPGPMHLVSLALHLANIVLVGLLAKTLSDERGKPGKTNLLACAAMVFYGLHPALIEPVSWISCQAELVLTFVVLVGVLANAQIQRVGLRAVGVAACFFLAATAKESAITFPALVVLFDWIGMEPQQRERGFLEQVRFLLRRQWPVYVAILIAGMAYLALRHIALGFLLNNASSAPLPLAAQLQRVAYTLFTYWRSLIWPMTGLAPTHVVDPRQFETFSLTAAGIDLAGLTLVVAGLYGTFKRSPIGYAILAVNIALFPVLHILPAYFDPSLYHERYLMLGLALALALLPRVASGISLPAAKLRIATAGCAGVILLWLGLAIVNIRVTVPLWANGIRLWQWDLTQNPHSQIAKTNLLALYVDHGDRIHADELADKMLDEEKECSLCLINVAALAITEGDLPRAERALEAAATSIGQRTEPFVWKAFILARGRLRESEHDFVNAAGDYQDAIKLDPLDPKAHMAFALFLARQGNAAEARMALNESLPLLSPDMREVSRQFFELTLAAGTKPAQLAPVQQP
jgi:hypothetical protein